MERGMRCVVIPKRAVELAPLRLTMINIVTTCRIQVTCAYHARIRTKGVAQIDMAAEVATSVFIRPFVTAAIGWTTEWPAVYAISSDRAGAVLAPGTTVILSETQTMHLARSVQRRSQVNGQGLACVQVAGVAYAVPIAAISTIFGAQSQNPAALKARCELVRVRRSAISNKPHPACSVSAAGGPFNACQVFTGCKRDSWCVAARLGADLSVACAVAAVCGVAQIKAAIIGRPACL